MNANWLVQTMIDIDLKVYNAIKLVRRCPPTINKKTSTAMYKRKITMFYSHIKCADYRTLK